MKDTSSRQKRTRKPWNQISGHNKEITLRQSGTIIFNSNLIYSYLFPSASQIGAHEHRNSSGISILFSCSQILLSAFIISYDYDENFSQHLIILIQKAVSLKVLNIGYISFILP